LLSANAVPVEEFGPMTTSTAAHVFLGLLALCAAGCDVVRDQGNRVTRTSEREQTEEVAPIPPPPPASQPPTTAPGPATSASNPSASPIPTREDWKTAPKKDDPAAPAAVDTRTLEGTVRAIDAQRRLISVNVRGQSQTLPVDPKAPIENLADQGHALKGGLAAIRPGASVLLVIYRNKSDREFVSLIRVKMMSK
jgi:hypothetical protein